MRQSSALAALVVGFCLPFAAVAQFEVGAGSSVDFADATIDFGCANFVVDGSATAGTATLSGIGDVAGSGALQAGASLLSLGGDFAPGAGFDSGTGTVEIVDACGDGSSAVAGANTFNAFSVVTTSGKQLLLPAQMSQRVVSLLRFEGAAGALLQVRSTVPGANARLQVADDADQTIAYVDAADNTATEAVIAPGDPAIYRSVDSGNLLFWFRNRPPSMEIEVRTIPGPGSSALACLALLMALIAAFALRRGGAAATNTKRVRA